MKQSILKCKKSAHFRFLIFLQVERAIITINSAVSNQIDWEEIEEIVREAKVQNDPVAKIIKSLNLETNKITLVLK